MITPAQIENIQKQFPGAIVLHKQGDFYNAFNNDARTVAKSLGLVIQSTCKVGGIPLCGIPAHILQGSIAELLSQGHCVCLCDTTSPKCKERIEK